MIFLLYKLFLGPNQIFPIYVSLVVQFVPIPPKQRSKMGPQRRLGIYVGFLCASIIHYLEPLIGNLFTARFLDCHFDESVFPSLGEDKPNSNNVVIEIK